MRGAVLPPLVGAAAAARPPFSWGSVPVFFHSQNESGPWNPAAAAAIARYPMATFEKAHAAAGRTEASESTGPAACRQINAINASVATMYYLNSVIDWQFYTLHDQLEAHPEWRLKDSAGDDILITAAQRWGFNVSVRAVRDAWVADCVAATQHGCGGCFIDRSNNMSQLSGTQRIAADAAAQFQRAHMDTLAELNARLAGDGKFAIGNNEMALPGAAAMMLEDFAASEYCITALRTAVSRGLVVQAHAGDLADGSDAKCAGGVTNSLSAFLIGAGDFSYYHCAPGWASETAWPAVSDYWLDWLPEYDRPLGRPTGDGRKEGGVWLREFGSGTRVAFDAAGGNGTISWADGVVQRGSPAPGGRGADAADTGCKWATRSAIF